MQKIVGIMLLLFSVTLVIPLITSFIYSDGNHYTFIYSFLIILGLGSILYLPNISAKNDIKIKEEFSCKQSAKDILITSQLRTALILNKNIKELI